MRRTQNEHTNKTGGEEGCGRAAHDTAATATLDSPRQGVPSRVGGQGARTLGGLFQ
jgi:hypothetical protein